MTEIDMLIDDLKMEAKKFDKSVLEEAHDIVRGRDKGYGNPVDSAVRIASAFTQITGRKLYPRDIALIQMLSLIHI